MPAISATSAQDYISINGGFRGEETTKYNKGNRWHKLVLTPKQAAFYNCKSRFIVVPAGRRSGKTEVALRKIDLQYLLSFVAPYGGRYVLSAPTRAQAKSIFWDSIRQLIPPGFVLRKSETELKISLINGKSVQVVGLDEPARIEGTYLDGIVLDEYGNMKPEVWTKHVLPALYTEGRPPGFAWFIGVPEGKNHFYDVWCQARTKLNGEWDGFTWRSEDILSPTAIASAKASMDEQTYEQEYGASFLTFSGLAYYSWKGELHTDCDREYDPRLNLDLCFDFNTSPGTLSLVQSFDGFDAAVGEVYIPSDSNTEKVCDRFLDRYWGHEGTIYLYGDATGGAKGTAKLSGSDWDIIESKLRPAFPGRVKNCVPRSNPRERQRINVVNSRLKAQDGSVRFRVNPKACPNLVRDFESTVLKPDGSGEIDKSFKYRNYSHCTDGIGYCLSEKYSLVSQALHRIEI